MTKARTRPLLLHVKSCSVGGKKAWGITDGKKWFFYAYETKDWAEAMARHFKTPELIRVNINVSQPVQMVQPIPD